MSDKDELEMRRRLDQAIASNDARAELNYRRALAAMDTRQGGQSTRADKQDAEVSMMAPLMQGLTFGWADELGGLGARLGGWLAGADEARREQIAQAEMERQRAQLAAAREQAFWPSTALEVGGSLVSGGPLARLARGGLGLLGVGTGAGALAGAGAADENKLAGAALGGAAGGAMAGAVPAAGYLARRGAGAIRGAIQPMVDKLRQEPATRAGRILGEQLQAQGMTPAALASRARQLGPQATLAEAAGEAGQAIGQGVIGADPTGQARLLAARQFTARTPGMNERIRQAVAKTTGISERLQPSLDAVRSKQTAAASQLYGSAYAQEMPLTGKLKNLLKRPPMARAFAAAKESAETIGEELPPWFKMNELGEWEKVGVMPDMRAWDRMKQGIDKIIDVETDAVTGRLSSKGRDLVIMKNQLLGELDDINPTYAIARRVFAGDEAVQNAMRTGEKFLGMKTRDVHQAVKNMSDSERESFLTGAVESIRERVGRARSGEMGAFKFLETDNAMEKLRAVFPKGREGDRALAELNRNLRRERVLRETENALLRGSQTAPRQQAAEALGGQAAIPTSVEAIRSPISSGINVGLAQAAKTLGREKQETIDALAQMLFTSGRTQDAIAELSTRGVPPAMIKQYMNRFSVGSAALAPAFGLGAGEIVR